jgi:hypothetical protein
VKDTEEEDVSDPPRVSHLPLDYDRGGGVEPGMG